MGIGKIDGCEASNSLRRAAGRRDDLTLWTGRCTAELLRLDNPDAINDSR